MNPESAGRTVDDASPVRSSSVFFAGTAVSRLFDLWAILLIARHFGEEALGQFSFAVAYVGYFAIMIDLGFNITFVKEMVREEARQAVLLTGMLVFKAIMTCTAIALAAALIMLGDYPLDTIRMVWIMTLALLISPKLPSMRLVYEQVFQSRISMEIPGLLKITDGILLLALIYGTIETGRPLMWTMVAYVASGLPGLVLLMIASRRLVRPAASMEWQMMLKLTRKALPIALLGAFSAVYSRLDVLFLSVFREESAIGFYASAYRLAEAFRILPAAVLASLYPYLVASTDRIRDAFIPALNRGIKPLLVILIPVCIGVSFLSESLLVTIYGSRYLPAAEVLVVLVWAELFVMMATVLSHALLALDRQRSVVWINGLMLFVNVLVNSQLIPLWGFLGAGFARLVTECAGVLGYTAVLRKASGWVSLQPIVPLLPAGLALALWLYFFDNLSLWFVLAGATLVYCSTLFVTRAVTGAELVQVYRALIPSRA